MNDTISRQAVIDRINKQREHLNPSEDFRDLIGDSAYKTCIEFIERLPSVQKTGKWLTPKEYCQHLYETTGERYSPAPTGLESFVYCSQCGETSWFSNKYCPHCGSRNRGEEE